MTISNCLFFLALVWSMGSVHAGLLVGVQPLDRAHNTLFLGEITPFAVSLFNDAPLPAEQVVVKVTAENELKLIEQAREVSEVTTTIPRIAPGERARVIVVVKAGSPQSSQGLRVAYGAQGQFMNAAYIPVLVSEGPLAFTATPIRPALERGGKSSITVNARNVFARPLQNVTILLDLPSGITPLGPPLVLPELPPGAEIADKGLGFELDPGITGTKTIAVKALYTLDGNVHVLERRVQVSVTENLFLVGLAGLIVLFVAAAAYLQTRNKKA